MLRVGIIGTGGISAAHISGYLEHAGDCEIVALCDIVPSKALGRKDEFGLGAATVYDDAATMLAAERLDLVSIATPPNTHAPLTISALDAGVNVLVEKPMAPSLEECDAMIAAAKASGKTLSVVAQNRFRDDMATLKEALDSGLIGSISHAQINSVWSRSLPYYDLWWRGTWASEGGGCTLNHAIHHLDLTLWLLGRPNSVTAVLSNAQHENAEVEDLSVAILAYDRALAEVTSSVVHQGEDQQSIVIQGRDARVAQPWHAAADLHAALREGREPAITATDGRNSIELVTAIYESGIERRTVDFPLAPEDPYYSAGTLIERAPHFYEKTASVGELDGEITVGASKA